MDRIVVRQEAGYYPVLPNPGTRGTKTLSQQTNAFYQQKAEILPERLTITASLSQFNQYNETENVTIPTPATLTATSIQRQNRLLHRVGAVFNITKEVVLYGIESSTIVVQTSRLIDGTITPPQDGKLKEVGVKTDLWQGRFSATLGFFDNQLTNVGVSAGTASPITGQNYVVLIGKQITRGADLTLTLRPLRQWQLVAGYDKHTVKDGYGNGNLPVTNTGSWNLFTRYEFQSDALKRFAIGGGANRFFNRIAGGGTSAAPNFLLPDGSALPTNGSPGGLPYIKMKDGTMASLFIDYKATKRLTFKLTVNNLFNEFFAVGFQHAFAIDPSLPRNVQFSAAFKL